LPALAFFPFCHKSWSGLPVAHVQLFAHSVHLNLTAADDSTIDVACVLATIITMLSRQVATAGARVGGARGFSVLTAAEEFPG